MAAARMLRPDLMASERIAELHFMTRWLWLALFTAADDFGLVELSYGSIRRAAPLEVWTREQIEKMLAELTDAELITPYEVEGKRYAAMQRWQSHVNSMRPRCPLPTWGLSHCRAPLGFKDQKTRISASLYFKHLPDLVGHQPPTSGSLVPEEVRGKREEVKEKPKAKPSVPKRARCDGFDEFWSTYPRKDAKTEAITAWDKLDPDAELRATILAAIASRKQSDQWKRGIIPLPATYLNKRRWEDQGMSATSPQGLIPGVDFQ